MRFSIVTVCFNDLDGLIKTCESVYSQTIQRSSYQHIVIDANSNDGTKDYLEECSHKIDFISSEPDEGIFYGMNKGLDNAVGEYVIFLNSGDVFYNDSVLLDVNSVIEKNNDVCVMYFGRVVIHSKNKGSDPYSSRIMPGPGIDRKNIKEWLSIYQPNHQSVFIPRCFYNKNKYDVSYRVASDVDYKLRCMHLHSIMFIDFIISIYDGDGVSSDLSTFRKTIYIIKEILSVYKKNNIGFFKRVSVMLRYLVKFVLMKFPVVVINSLLNARHKNY